MRDAIMTASKHAYGHGGGAEFVPAQEIFHLTKLIRENRGRIYGDASNVVPIHGEVSTKSFRDWSLRNILLWRSESKNDPFASVDVQSVSRATAANLAYQVDFSISSKGNTQYFALRINPVSPTTFTLTIQLKNNASSIPLGMAAAPIIWSKAGRVNGLY
jgi:hypothetical protein